ncbi:MAG: DUF389 domain-containing protein [Solirubrobacterales bacterium]|nr:DUF389 domain-containing protein [Solirubrobacterales bacterium]
MSPTRTRASSSPTCASWTYRLRGSIAVEEIDTAISAAATRAVRLAEGQPGDAVVREEVEACTGDTASLSATFLTFAVVAALITSVAIALDSEVLLIGGMVVGPEFGPIAGFCVAAVQRRSGLAKQTQKSGALIGVLVSVTTLPAASYAGLAAAYGDWEAARGSLIQLVTNLVCIFVAGLATLGLQRLLYERRRARHLRER